MNTELAIQFLENHQPMPSDEDLSEKLIQTYDEVRRHFLKVPDKRCISLFLNSFGNIDGFGVYQLVEDVILQFQKEDVIPILIKTLKSDYYSVRYWCAMISANYPSLELLSTLKNLLYEDDFDIKAASLTSLSMYKFEETVEILKKYIEYESDEELNADAKNILLTFK
ncbi:HEAT repeat domain-containing protein [Flavobacterium sp. H4147]|uniref:HEAT repeat domain-containing protein n=1 Tax=Flavobacterium sp. H4147 TaxID=3034149 RepID=UPI0023EBE9AC|nr:HEAT repeat domain-containing protein [Flavobacterium sp. H4147]